MTNIREATWEQLGHDVTGARSMETVLQKSGLDYEVEKRPVQLESGVVVPNRFATVRKTDGHVYDIVSDRYSVVQNREAFEFIDHIADRVEFLKAGETASGMVWVIAAMEEVDVLGDRFRTHVILRNGFAGNTKITAAIIPLRVVCQNQFNHAFREATNQVRVLHVGDVQSKMREAQELLQLQAGVIETLQKNAERYATTPLPKGYEEEALDRLFPVNEDTNAYAAHRNQEARSAFLEAYNQDDNTEFRGTAWGMINAYSDFITHREPTGKSDTRFENRFIRNTFRPVTTPDVLQTLVRVA